MLSFITVPKFPVISKDPGSFESGSNTFLRTVSMYNVEPPRGKEENDFLLLFYLAD